MVMPRLIVRERHAFRFREADLKAVRTWQDVSGATCAYGYVGDGGNWMRWPGLVTFHVAADGTIDAFPERPVEPSTIVDLCRRTVEPIVLQSLGWETLHASAVCTPPGVFAICGERQAGKSTLAFALSRRGYRQYADDMLVLQVAPDGTRALDRPFGVRLRSEAASYFGFTPDGRHFQDVTEIDSRVDSGSTQPLAAVFVLRRTDTREPAVEPLRPAGALAAVLPHTYCFNPDENGRKRVLTNYLQITTTVPFYEVSFSTGLDRIDSVLNLVESVMNQPQVVNG